MTNEEAIKVLKDMIPKTCKMVNGRYVGGFEDTECPQFEAVQVAVEALEKQIPKVAEHEDGVWSLCTCCGGSVCNDTEHAVNKEVSYCEHCGQAIDWENSGLE